MVRPCSRGVSKQEEFSRKLIHDHGTQTTENKNESQEKFITLDQTRNLGVDDRLGCDALRCFGRQAVRRRGGFPRSTL
jgi:hypothetical protein